MKKLSLGKSILLSILVAFVVFAIIRIYHYQVLKNISDASKSFLGQEEYNYIVKTVRGDMEDLFEQYKNGNKAYSKNYYINKKINYEADDYRIEVLDEEFLNLYSYSTLENELDICTYSKETLDNYIRPTNFSSYIMHDLNEIYFDSSLYSKISTWLHYKIMYPVVHTREYNGKECYMFNEFSSIRTWVDKETLLPVKVEYLENDGQVFQTIYYEYNKLSDEVIELPNPKDYEVVKYYDNGKQVEGCWGKPAENAISGTNLKPDEMLVQNVELKDNEVLNFLELTPNEDGIISLNIYSYDTYNKFRTKYSGLRELTEKDFERYFVSIAFKDGVKLEFLEEWESGQENITNVIVYSQKSNKDNFTLLVLPKSTGNMGVNYVESDKKIVIDSYDAVDKIQEYLEDFGKKYNLENMDFMGYRNDVLCRLTNKKFAELDYIINPVKGKEPICWEIDYCVYRVEQPNAEFDYLIIYVDATTGEVIGSKTKSDY